jgi:predicted metal-binding membrane protein
LTDVPQGSVPRLERLVALSSLLGVALLAWLYLWLQSAEMAAPHLDADMQDMPGMDGMGEPAPAAPADPWSGEVLLLTALMWAIMMVGMMLPSAAPAILLYGSMARKHRERGSSLPSVWIFALGYLAVWAAFSVVATALQAALEATELLTPMLVSASAPLSGVLLVVAGVYQWLPVKAACLEKCRAPLQFFLMRWKPGAVGAFRMGAVHGAFCVGCCWALMLLLFAAGVMNLIWLALIAGFVLVEKLLPGARIVGRVAGAVLVAAGVVMLIDASLFEALRF